MAACTSRAAASMLRFKSNCSVIEVEPSVLAEVISVTAAMCPNWRSRGVATEEAMVCALAPGRLALTEMVGKSTGRQRRNRQKPERDRASKSDRHRQKRGGDGPADEWLRDAHACRETLRARRSNHR